MPSTTFINQQTVIQADWLNDVNNMTYVTGPGFNTTKANAGANTDITSLSNVTVPTQSNGTSNNLIANTLFVNNAIASTPSLPQIQSISGSVASNALTISVGTVTLSFRSITLASGTVSTITGSPSNLVVPSGATLGTISGIASSLIVLALNNAGTIELAVVNLAGGVDISETGLISTTAISAGSTSSNVVYSTTTRTNLTYRVLGRIDSTQSTAGVWATVPSLIQGAGGQAVVAMSSLGYGQTWQNVTGSRTSGTTYYNTTGKPIMVAISDQTFITNLIVNGVTIAATGTTNVAFASAVVPPNGSYSATASTITRWLELR